jgi:hypothetical protein
MCQATIQVLLLKAASASTGSAAVAAAGTLQRTTDTAEDEDINNPCLGHKPNALAVRDPVTACENKKPYCKRQHHATTSRRNH